MAQNEIQTLDLYSAPTGGTFQLAYNGQLTGTIAHNASAATIDTALEGVPSIGSGNVSVTGGPLPGSTVTIEFISGLAETNVYELEALVGSLTGGTISASVVETTAGFPQAWGIDTASYVTASSAFPPPRYNAFQLVFGSDGTKLYTLTSSWIYQHTLSTAWDLSTISYDSKTLSTSSQTSFPGQIAFSSDGTRLYVACRGGVCASVFEYTMTTAWDISTASYNTLYSSPSSPCTALCFNEDGTKLYTYQYSTGVSVVHQSTLSTAWDVSTASDDTKSLDVSSQVTSGSCVAIGDSGTKFYVLDYSAPVVAYQYTLGTAYDISTGSYASKSFDFSSQDSSVSSFYLKSNGQKMFALGSGNDKVYEYDVGGPGQDEVQTISIIGSPSQGTFTAAYAGYVATINYDSTAAEMETALEALDSIGSGNVTCAGGPLPGTAITVTFTADLGDLDVDLLELDDSKLQFKIETTQTGAPTPSQASASWSTGPNVYSAIDNPGTAVWSSTDATASGIPEVASVSWTTGSLQATGILSSTLPTATWTAAATAAAGIPQQASAAWSSGTAILPGVFSDSARAKWKTLQFGAIPADPVMAFWSTGSVAADHNPVNVPAVTWSSGSAIPAPAINGQCSSAWSTGELTVDLTLELPTATWSTPEPVLSPVLTAGTATWSTTSNVYAPVIGTPAYIGFATFNLLGDNADLEIINITNEAVSVPQHTSVSVSQPAFTSQTLTAPGLTSESLDS